MDEIDARTLRASPRLHRTSGPRILTIALDRVVESIEHLATRGRWPFHMSIAAFAARRQRDRQAKRKHDAKRNRRNIAFL
ncbi:hypothetical protein [Burkholderia sp. Bp9099]|uniref:hypothetical protein n=1 Tax=Burkholderia sp. Bp9099 TaxID=2184568 RepID=UPI00163A9B76|nr:hypothetical protein [Burkholderia sp. Bp9099]